MPIDQIELARRIRQARESCGMTQEETAERLAISRPILVQIEQGKRPVSGLELQKLAYLFAREIREFLADDFVEDDVVRVLFRSHEEFGDDDVKQALRDCIALGRELTGLEELLGVTRASVTVAEYSHSFPKGRWEAIQIGEQVAREERRRLGLGSAPLGDVVTLLESQGVRTGALSLPEAVSGLMISHAKVGLLVAINGSHPSVRQRFSWCHEYSHVLLDRDSVGLISRESDRDNLREVRANSFGASFLLPEDGVRQFVASIGKGASSRLYAEVYDEAGVVPIDARTEAGTQELQLYDVVRLAHSFGVSVPSSLYRLRNLKLMSEREFERLKSLDEEGRSRRIAEFLGLPAIDARAPKTEFYRRYLSVALEALRREKISRAKFFELAGRIGIDRMAAQNLAETAGIDNEEAEPVLLPED